MKVRVINELKTEYGTAFIPEPKKYYYHLSTVEAAKSINKYGLLLRFKDTRKKPNASIPTDKKAIYFTNNPYKLIHPDNGSGSFFDQRDNLVLYRIDKKFVDNLKPERDLQYPLGETEPAFAYYVYYDIPPEKLEYYGKLKVIITTRDKGYHVNYPTLFDDLPSEEQKKLPKRLRRDEYGLAIYTEKHIPDKLFGDSNILKAEQTQYNEAFNLNKFKRCFDTITKLPIRNALFKVIEKIKKIFIEKFTQELVKQRMLGSKAIRDTEDKMKDNFDDNTNNIRHDLNKVAMEFEKSKKSLNNSMIFDSFDMNEDAGLIDVIINNPAVTMIINQILPALLDSIIELLNNYLQDKMTGFEPGEIAKYAIPALKMTLSSMGLGCILNYINFHSSNRGVVAKLDADKIDSASEICDAIIGFAEAIS